MDGKYYLCDVKHIDHDTTSRHTQGVIIFDFGGR